MNTQENKQVIVVDIKMPFLSMVSFMVKWAVAAIPAFFILAMFGAVLFGVLNGIMHR